MADRADYYFLPGPSFVSEVWQGTFEFLASHLRHLRSVEGYRMQLLESMKALYPIIGHSRVAQRETLQQRRDARRDVACPLNRETPKSLAVYCNLFGV